jgi:hypothetical protein
MCCSFDDWWLKGHRATAQTKHYHPKRIPCANGKSVFSISLKMLWYIESEHISPPLKIHEIQKFDVEDWIHVLMLVRMWRSCAQSNHNRIVDWATIVEMFMVARRGASALCTSWSVCSTAWTRIAEKIECWSDVQYPCPAEIRCLYRSE